MPMAEQETKKKKRRKQQIAVLKEVQTEEEQNVAQVTEVLEELEKQGKKLDIQVCPKCKSPRVRRAKSSEADMLGNMGLLPPKFQCDECGWQARLDVKATNKPLTVKEVELILEARELADEEPK
jgi:hypothetical protein